MMRTTNVTASLSAEEPGEEEGSADLNVTVSKSSREVRERGPDLNRTRCSVLSSGREFDLRDTFLGCSQLA